MLKSKINDKNPLLKIKWNNETYILNTMKKNNFKLNTEADIDKINKYQILYNLKDKLKV